MKRRSLRLAVILIAALWGVRLSGIGSFPPFIDETIHIHTAEIILHDGTPFYNVVIGRQFMIWWLVPFQPAAAAPMWVARVAVLLAVLPGFAALLLVARVTANRWGMLLFGILAIFNAYHMFFERLALADQVAGSAAALALAVAYRLRKRVRLRDALVTGALLFVVFGAKTSAAPYMGIPLAAALTLHPSGASWRASLRDRLRWLAVALISAFGLAALYVVGLWLRGYDIITNSLSLAVSGRGSLALETLLSPTRILNNAALTIDNLTSYLGTMPLILLVLAVVVLIARGRWYLPLCLFAPVVVIWVNTVQEDRYFMTPVSLLLLCGAVVMARLTQRDLQLRVLALGAIAVWGLTYWLPFALTAARDPAALPLSTADYNQYIKSDAAGFGFAEAYAALRDSQPQQVFGLLSNCQGLRYTVPPDFPLICPLVRPDGQDRAALAALLDENRLAGSFAIIEDSPYTPKSSPGRVVAVIDAGRPRLTIYDLTP